MLWALVTRRLMNPLPLVEQLDIAEDRRPGFLARSEDEMVKKLVLSLDCQFLELGCVCLFRYFYFLSSKSGSVLGRPWQTHFRGNFSLRKFANPVVNTDAAR